jgi:superfamily II DNA or RNA helicase
MIELRDYQKRTIDKCRELAAAGYTRILVVAPTGSGKMCTAAFIMQSALRNFGARSLFAVHRKEVVEHCVRQLARFGVTEVGVMRADDERTDPTQPIQVASKATLMRRDPPHADIVIFDECHFSPDATREILRAFPNAQVFGFTATAIGPNGSGLGGEGLFQIIVQSASYKELIAAGWIAEPMIFGIERPVDLSGVATTAGDFDVGGLEFTMDQPQVVGDIVDTWMKRSEGRRTVAFACTIKHSLSIVERFQKAGVRAAHLDGTTSEIERDRLLAALDSGEIQVLSNVDVLSEGFDQPSCKYMIGARPTLSIIKHMQQPGRFLRPWNNVRPIIADHAGNMDRHGAPHLDRQWGLDGSSRLVEKNPYRMCPRCFAYVAKNPCELCGFAPPVEEREIRENAAPALVEKKQEDVRRADFLALVQTASARGFKPGYASAKYKEKHGDWPPRSWGEEAKRMYAADKGWQFRQVKRENERAYWQDQKRQDDTPIAPEDAFGGWLKPPS